MQTKLAKGFWTMTYVAMLAKEVLLKTCGGFANPKKAVDFAFAVAKEFESQSISRGEAILEEVKSEDQ